MEPSRRSIPGLVERGQGRGFEYLHYPDAEPHITLGVTLPSPITTPVNGLGARPAHRFPRDRCFARLAVAPASSRGRCYRKRANAYAMIGRRAAAAGIATKLGNTVSGRQGSRLISKTAARSRRRPRWRTTRRRARHSSTIAGATRSASMRSSGL